MTRIFSQSTGTEELLDEVETVLISDINDALDQVYNRQEASDQARALRRNIPYFPIEYEYVPPDHFHTGNFPSISLEEVPLDSYPYIVLTIEGYTPNPESARDDHKNVYDDILVVHCLAQASLEEGSETVFRRSVRMGEAVYIALMSNTAMEKKLSASANPVRGQTSLPFTSNYKGRGDKWWFQSCGTQYSIKSYTSMWGV